MTSPSTRFSTNTEYNIWLKFEFGVVPPYFFFFVGGGEAVILVPSFFFFYHPCGIFTLWSWIASDSTDGRLLFGDMCIQINFSFQKVINAIWQTQHVLICYAQSPCTFASKFTSHLIKHMHHTNLQMHTVGLDLYIVHKIAANCFTLSLNVSILPNLRSADLLSGWWQSFKRT